MKKLLCFLAAIVMAIVLVACATPPAPSAPQPPTQASNNQQQALPAAPDNTLPAVLPEDIITDLTDIANYWIEIDGVRYNIGDPFRVWASNFIIARTHAEMVETTYLRPWRATALRPTAEVTLHSDMDRWQNGSFFARISNTLELLLRITDPSPRRIDGLHTRVVNNSDEDILVQDGTVFEVTIGRNAIDRWFEHVRFINGIEILSTTRADIEAMFGAPDDTYQSIGSWVSLYYFPLGQEMHTGYTFLFYRDLLVSVSMRFLEQGA